MAEKELKKREPSEVRTKEEPREIHSTVDEHIRIR